MCLPNFICEVINDQYLLIYMYTHGTLLLKIDRICRLWLIYLMLGIITEKSVNLGGC